MKSKKSLFFVHSNSVTPGVNVGQRNFFCGVTCEGVAFSNTPKTPACAYFVFRLPTSPKFRIRVGPQKHPILS